MATIDGSRRLDSAASQTYLNGQIKILMAGRGPSTGTTTADPGHGCVETRLNQPAPGRTHPTNNANRGTPMTTNPEVGKFKRHTLLLPHLTVPGQPH